MNETLEYAILNDGYLPTVGEIKELARELWDLKHNSYYEKAYIKEIKRLENNTITQLDTINGLAKLCNRRFKKIIELKKIKPKQ